jgi:hypothetical protein
MNFYDDDEIFNVDKDSLIKNSNFSESIQNLKWIEKDFEITVGEKEIIQKIKVKGFVWGVWGIQHIKDEGGEPFYRITYIPNGYAVSNTRIYDLHDAKMIAEELQKYLNKDNSLPKKINKMREKYISLKEIILSRTDSLIGVEEQCVVK